MGRPSLVITSIAAPTALLRGLAAGARRNGVDLIVIGDLASPEPFELAGCDFYSLERQLGLGLGLAAPCPVGHYARKNIGYLLAMRQGATAIMETDDDTIAYDSFWEPPARSRPARTVRATGWVNVYRYFSPELIWPRGFPLDEARRVVPEPEVELGRVESPIQQALIDDDPDVDAVYRLLLPLPFRFSTAPSVALAPGAWCPFNSQNTTWWPEAYPLMYLPATCSFRMTDIWRSFVAQRLAWVNGWCVLFHEPTVSQSRNVHDLMHDFRREVPGYLGNKAFCGLLEGIALRPGAEHVHDNMRTVYGALVEAGFLRASELPLLDAWLADVASLADGLRADPAPALPSS
jgi:STELLO glycosyltransferases